MGEWIENATPIANEARFAIPILDRFDKELVDTISSRTRDGWLDCVNRLAQEFASQPGDVASESNDAPSATPLRHHLGLNFDPKTNELSRDGYENPILLRGTETIALITALMQGGKQRFQSKSTKDEGTKSLNNLIAQRVTRLNEKIAPLKVAAKLRGTQYEFVEI